MINCIIVSKSQVLINEFKYSIQKVFCEYFELSYRLIIIDECENYVDINRIISDDLSILFFDERMEKSILYKFCKSRPDIYLVVFSKKKEISFFYECHIYSLLSYDNSLLDYIHLIKSLILVHYSHLNRKIHFISNKAILLIDSEQIIKLQYHDHKLILKTLDNVYQVSGSLKDYLFLVKKSNFKLNSRSTIINLDYF